MHGNSSRSEVGERPFPDQLGGTDTLAVTFAVADRWFVLVFCQIQPNWRYFVAATPADMVDDILPETSFGCLRDDFRPPRYLAQCVAELPRKLCAGQLLFLGDVIRGDFSSILILAMVERKSSLLLFTHRAVAAAGLADLLDLTQPAFANPSTHAGSLVGSAQFACKTSGPVRIPSAGIGDNRLVNAAPRCASICLTYVKRSAEGHHG